MCTEDLNAEWLFGDIGCYGEYSARRWQRLSDRYRT